jgi:hypothetical protein
MLTKNLLTILIMVPLMAISAAAHAGSTITDKSYWPSEARAHKTRLTKRKANLILRSRTTDQCRGRSMRTTLHPHGVIRAAQNSGDVRPGPKLKWLRTGSTSATCFEPQRSTPKEYSPFTR